MKIEMIKRTTKFKVWGIYLALAVILLLNTSLFAETCLCPRVVDGDTIVVKEIGKIRLIGVDTPETVHPRKPVECFSKEASALFTGKRLSWHSIG